MWVVTENAISENLAKNQLKIDHCTQNQDYLSIKKKTKSGSTRRITSGSVFRPIIQTRVGAFREQMVFPWRPGRGFSPVLRISNLFYERKTIPRGEFQELSYSALQYGF